MAKYNVVDLLVVLDLACVRFRELFFGKDNRDVASLLFDRRLLGKDLCEMLAHAVEYLEKNDGRDFGDLKEVCQLGFAIFETWMFLEKYESGTRVPAGSSELYIMDDNLTYAYPEDCRVHIRRPSKGQMAMVIVADFIMDAKNRQGEAKQDAMDMLSEMPPGLDIFHPDLVRYRTAHGVPEFDSLLLSNVRLDQTQRFVREMEIADMIQALCWPMGFQYATLHVLARFSLCPPPQASVLNNLPLLGQIRRAHFGGIMARGPPTTYDSPTQEEIDGISSTAETAGIEKSLQWMLKRIATPDDPISNRASFVLHHALRVAWSGFKFE